MNENILTEPTCSICGNPLTGAEADICDGCAECLMLYYERMEDMTVPS